MAELKLKVVPSSSRDQISGWLGDSLKVKVKAPPEKGKANRAVIALLSDTLNLPPDSFRLLRGESSPQKVLEIESLSDEELRQRLAASSK